ncbi:MAG TPA: hypothetical protein DEO54_08325 [Rikenellaceae bacterium]|nr:MAG: hypothetical protein A2X20_04020 [Bacteroidetes bacterium GWE2_40_15]HBZ26224.1 hypothetical protein [Rikenellaceae bacterium]
MRIALISDIHEDIISLKRALKIIERERCDEIVCLGDTLGYPYMRGGYENSRDLSECINIVRQNCSTVLLGNHDLFHMKRLPKFYKGFEFPDNWYEFSQEEHTLFSKNRVWNYSDDLPINLSEGEREYMLSLQEYSTITVNNRNILFSHSMFPNFTAYVCASRHDTVRLREHFHYLKESQIEISICGHLHMEGLGIAYEAQNSLFSKLFPGFVYYSYGERIIRNRLSCITIPAIADNGQENGFAILNITKECNNNVYSINSLSLNTNRRFIL